MRCFLVMLFSSIFYLSWSQVEPLLLDPNFNSFYLEHEDKLWISSEKGWNCFDGLATKHYSLSDSLSGLEGSFIQSSLIPDKEGRLWTSTYEKMCHFDPSTEKFLCEQLSWEQSSLKEGYHIFDIDSLQQKLYFKAQDKLYTYQISDGQVERLSRDETLGVRFTKSSETYYATPWIQKNGIEVWEKMSESNWSKTEFEFERCSAPISKALVSQIINVNKNIYLISNIGLIEFNGNDPCSSKIYKSTAQQNVLNNGIAWDNHLIISSEGSGLLFFDLAENRFIDNDAFGELNLMSMQPTDLFLDASNYLWISHPNLGIQKVKITDLIPSAISKGFKKEEKQNIRIMENSVLFFDKNNQLKLNDNESTQTFKVNTASLPLSTIRYAELIDQKSFICADFHHIYQCEKGKSNCELIWKNKALQLNDLKTWNDQVFFTANNQLYTLDNESNAISERLNKLHSNSIRAIGNITDDQFAILLSSSKVHLNHSSKDTIIDIGRYVTQIIFDSKNKTYWVATTGGLFQINEQFETSQILEETHLIGNSIIDQIILNNEQLFIIGEKGFYRLDTSKASLSRFGSSSSQPSNLLEHFYSVDNLDDSNRTEFSKRSVVLSGLKINDKKASIKSLSDGKIGLNWNENQIGIKFKIPSIHDASDCFILYRLLPSQKEWFSASNDQEIKFNSLAPDEYVLEVKGVDESARSTPIYKYEFCIAKPYWQRWWFITMLTSILISLGFFINYIRYKKQLRLARIKLEKQEALSHQRERMARDLHDEMGSGLSSIKFLGQNINNKNARNDLENIVLISGNLIGSMRELLWSLDEKNNNVEDLIGRIRMAINRQPSNPEIKLEIIDESNNSSIEVHGMARRNLLLILKESLNNALKHSNAQNILVQFSYTEDLLKLTVNDDGNGLEKELTKKGLGFSSMKNRVQELGGNMSVESSKQGLSLCFEIPITKVTW